MKRIFIILCILLLLAFLFSSVLAIEKVPKKETQPTKEQKEEVKQTPPPERKEEILPEKEKSIEEPKEAEVKRPGRKKEEVISRILKGLKSGLKEEKKEKYDYFIDKNGNGIDDRLEQEKTEKKPVKRETPSERKGRRGR